MILSAELQDLRILKAHSWQSLADHGTQWSLAGDKAAVSRYHKTIKSAQSTDQQ